MVYFLGESSPNARTIQVADAGGGAGEGADPELQESGSLGATRGSTRGVRPLPPPSAVWARRFSGRGCVPVYRQCVVVQPLLVVLSDSVTDCGRGRV